MKSPFQIEAVKPIQLTEKEKHELTDRLYKIHEEIFHGVSKAAFRKYVIEPDSKLTKIRIYRDVGGNDAGYLSFQVFETGPRRMDPFVVRTEVGFLPQYRRYNLTLPTLIRSAIAFQLKQLGRKGYFLATPVHPTPYRIGINQLPEVWPHPERETPQHIRETLGTLREALGIRPVPGGGEFACQVGWQVRESQILKDRIMRRTDPITQFYLRQNPDYSEGNGMLMLVPLTLKTYMSGLGGLFRKRFRRSVQWKTLTLRVPVPRFG